MTYQYIPFMAKIIRAQRAKTTSVPKKAAKPKGKSATKSAARPAKKSKAPKPKSSKPKSSKSWTPAEVREAFERFQKANPEPRGELEHLNPFTLLVAVVLSAQATDAGVNKATRELFKVADTPERMLELGEDRLRDYIRTIGLYRTKAKNVIALSAKLISDFGGEVPRTRAEIESPMASIPWRSTPMCSGSAIARGSHPARRRSRWNSGWRKSSRPSSCCMHITG
jgi:endonuclease-3